MTQLLKAVAANGDSQFLNVNPPYRHGYHVAKVRISGTAIVTLYGRFGATDSDWDQINQWTVSGMVALVVPPCVKFTVSGVSGTVSVDAWIDVLGNTIGN